MDDSNGHGSKKDELEETELEEAGSEKPSGEDDRQFGDRDYLWDDGDPADRRRDPLRNS